MSEETVPVKKRGRGPGKKPRKIHVSVRIDPDIVMWLNQDGQMSSKGINDLLRYCMKRLTP
jgi:uncharacterized protein (DUF4415 family)